VRGRLIHFCHSPGVALIVTLMMMSIMVMMVVGLAGVMRNEQAAARNLTYQVAAEQMADLGAREAMALVLSNSTSSIGFPTATGPGWMQVNGPAGKREVDLFSSNSAAQIKWLDRIGTNSLILSLPGAARGLIAACWTNVVTNGGNPNVPFGRYAWWVDDEGSKVNLNATGQNTNYLPFLNAFPIIGDWLFANPFTFVTNSASASRASALIARTNYLPTLESVKDTNLINPSGANSISSSVYRQIKGGVTVWSSNVDLTPWGTAKLNLADLTNTTLYPNPKAGMLAVKSALATNAFTNFFPAGQNLARKYGGGANTSTNLDNHGDLILQQIAANIMAAAGRPVTLTNGGDYFPPVGNNDARRHRNNLPLQVASHYIGPYLDQVRVRVDYRIQAQTNVEARLGIWVRVVNPYTNNFANWTLQVQPRKFIFGLCPPAGLYFSGDISPTDLNSSAPLSGYTGHSSYWSSGQVWVGPTWEQAPDKFPSAQTWPLGRVFSTNIAVGPKSYLDAFFTNVISYTIVTTNVANLPPQVRYAYVMLDQVCLYEGGATPTSLRDWLTHDDLSRSNTPADKVFRTSLDVGQMDFSDVSDTGNGPLPIQVTSFAPLSPSDFASATSLGVRRIDPQVRYPLVFWDSSGGSPTSMGVMKSGGWSLISRRGAVSGGIPSAWSTNPTFNCTNTNGSVTGLAYLWPDPAPGVNDVRNHPHFVPGYRPTNGFRSVAQLGAIHTGIPWRTLRLQPQPSVEMAAANGATNSPPDWVLLDVFSATNSASARAMVSLNGYPRMYGGIATNEDGSISTRALSFASLLGAASKIPVSDGNFCASNGIPTSLQSNSTVFTNIPGVAQNFTNVSTSPNQASVWPSAGAWGTYRQDNSNNFPRNGFLLAGEILEVAGVAEDTSANPAPGEDVLEGRLRSFMDLVTTRSDTFTVWSAGQGLVVNTNRGNRTNVMAEVRKQTVFQRIPMTNASGVTTNYSLKVLYTRNHVVE
jgi:hypothetical protein